MEQEQIYRRNGGSFKYCQNRRRAMTEEETSKFDELEKKIKAIDGTIERERARKMEHKEVKPTEVEEER